MTTEQIKNQTPLQDTKIEQTAPLPKKPNQPAPIPVPAQPAGASPSPAPQPNQAAESTEPAILKEATPITQDLPVNKVAETAKKAPELNEAEATIVKPNKIVEPVKEKPADTPAAETVQAKTIKEAPVKKTEQTLPVENKAELPQEAKIEQIPKSAPLPPQQIQSKPKQPEQQLKTPAPAPQASQPVQPLSRSASVKTAMPFMVKFKNKLAEFRQIANQKRTEKMQKNLSIITQYAREKQRITNDEVEKLTGVKDAQATNYLNILVKQGKLIRFGKKKNIFYKPINQ